MGQVPEFPTRRYNNDIAGQGTPGELAAILVARRSVPDTEIQYLSPTDAFAAGTIAELQNTFALTDGKVQVCIRHRVVNDSGEGYQVGCDVWETIDSQTQIRWVIHPEE